MASRLLHLRFDVQGDELEAARACEADVFARWYGNTAAQLAEEYGPYDETSVFIALMDEQGEAQASCRLIIPGAPGLKTYEAISRSPWSLDSERTFHAAGIDRNSCWDIATLGVRGRMRGTSTPGAIALYHGLMAAAQVNTVGSIVALADSRLRRLLDAVGVVLAPLPGARPAPYLGSRATTPVFGQRGIFDRQRRENPDSYRLIALGVGLDGIAVPKPEAFILHADRVVDLRPTPSPLQSTPSVA